MSLKDLLRRKPIEELEGGDDTAEGTGLKRVLTKWSLIAIGVAAIIGTGLFVLIGPAINNVAHPELSAGPSIVLSFVLCGLALLLVAYPYAELGSMIPVSGSAYTYAYVALGEALAWVIGWDLILEYAFGASAVAAGWSSYFQGILQSLGITLPSIISHAPKAVPWLYVLGSFVLLGPGILGAINNYAALKLGATRQERSSAAIWLALSAAAACGGLFSAVYVVLHLTSIDLPAIMIVVGLNFLLVKGVEHTAKMTGWFVVIKLVVIALFVALGVMHFKASNFQPFLPNGLHGMMAAAGAVFFAFIGFDAITCHAEECKDPQNDMKWGIMGSLVISTIVYVIVGVTIIGAVYYTNLVPPPGRESQEGAAFITVLEQNGYSWAVPVLAVGILASITSVLIVSLSSQARIMMRMAKDGLVVPFFSKVHPKYRTPSRSIWTCGLAIAALAGLLPIGELAELTSIGTLAAFVLVCIGVIVLRKTEPDRPRKFRCPDFRPVPLVFGLAGAVLSYVLFRHGVESTWVLLSAGVSGVSLVLWLLHRFANIQWIPAGGALVSLALMASLPGITWVRFIVWLALGAAVYLWYGRKHSLLAKEKPSKPE